jgi:hypothetical protein
MPDPFSTIANPDADAKLEPSISRREVMALPYRAAIKWPAPKQVRRDHSNQLDLFGSLSIGALAEVVPITSGAPHVEVSDATHKPIGHPDSQSLENLPAAAGGGTDAQQHAGTIGSASGGAGGEPIVSTPVGTEDAVPAGVGTGDGGMPVAGRPEIFDIEPEPSRDFRITSAHRIGVGSLHEKARDNILAIEAEARDATEEEKAVLARYVGWGGIAGVFESNYRRRAEWDKPAEELLQLLTDDEYESAQASTPNAHFTSPMVIQAIWDPGSLPR